MPWVLQLIKIQFTQLMVIVKGLTHPTRQVSTHTCKYMILEIVTVNHQTRALRFDHCLIQIKVKIVKICDSNTTHNDSY